MYVTLQSSTCFEHQNMPIFRRTNCIITASGIVILCKRLYSMPDESRLCRAESALIRYNSNVTAEGLTAVWMTWVWKHVIYNSRGGTYFVQKIKQHHDNAKFTRCTIRARLWNVLMYTISVLTCLSNNKYCLYTNTYKNMLRTFKVTSYPGYFLIVAHLVKTINLRNLN